ncbi:MAG: efflux transporter outer membrane subunit [Campylobacteraceae bacterium]|nr:efflux transporter outer membrane subunit [Campylobacteraceae bacterium]
MQLLKPFLIILTTIFLGGCTLHEDPRPAQIEMPLLPKEVRVEANWWEMYEDVTLNTLVEQALKYNFNIRQAAANVSLASAYLASADANRYPSIDGSAGAARAHSSKESVIGGGKTNNTFSLSAVLNYEVDLWGKIKNNKDAAAKSLLSSKATKDAVHLGLVSSVVDSYFGVISLKAQEVIAKESVSTQEEAYDILKEKYRLGLITSFDALLGESAIAKAKTTLSSIQTALVRQESALHVLLGTSPKELLESKDSFTKDKLPNSIEVPQGLSSSLLEQRPDIQAALYALEAANLDIKTAKADYFPSIGLSGLFGFSSTELKDLVGASARNWNIGGSLVAPIFDFGRVEAKVAQREAAREMALIGFEQSITQAFLEVYEAQNVRQSIYESKNNAIEQVDIYGKLANLATIRYEAGAGEYKSVLDAREDLLEANLNLIKAKQSALSADISLIKSLGGGWDKKDLREK